MTRPLSSFPEWERKAVARRRVNGAPGLGQLAADDFLSKGGELKSKKANTPEDINVDVEEEEDE